MQELYNAVTKLLCQVTRYCNDAMILCQSWGYNGFKRKYRIMAREFFNKKLCLENELYDKYRIAAVNSHETMAYNAASFKDHFSKWDKFLKETIDQLTSFSKQFLDQVGMENDTLRCVIDCLVKDYEKTGRYQKRFNEAGWNGHDMHRVDDDIHAKMKEIEEGK